MTKQGTFSIKRALWIVFLCLAAALLSIAILALIGTMFYGERDPLEWPEDVRATYAHASTGIFIAWYLIGLIYLSIKRRSS